MEVEAPRRSRGDSFSSEFEFWRVGNHPELQPEGIHTVDELFVDDVLLPLHLFSHHRSPNLEPKLGTEPFIIESPEPEPESSASITSTHVATSRRWKDIFKKSSSSSTAVEEKEKMKKERKDSSGGKGGSSRTELNINIWPFSRSRSAGTDRPKPLAAAAAAAAMSKSSSAPCLRSNSRGEGGVRRWAASPGRAGGVHVGRASPVWQLRPKAKVSGGGGAKRKAGGPGGLNLTVNSCIGYSGQVRCREDEEVVVGGASAAAAANIRLFRFGGLFTKKVY